MSSSVIPLIKILWEFFETCPTGTFFWINLSTVANGSAISENLVGTLVCFPNRFMAIF